MDSIRGDFDSAVKLCLQALTILERAGLETGNESLLLSRLYNIIGESESGLEWACMAEEQFKGRPYMINLGILVQIWSLILQKKLPEAQILLDTTRESILKSGDETQLAWLHFVTGLFEIERGDYSLASSSIEQSLRIYERFKWGLPYRTMFLHHLAKIEVYSSDTAEGVFPSLAILEEKAITEDLPGIQGQVLLLKGRLAIMNDDEALLREILSQLRLLIEEDNLEFLKPHLENLLTKL